MGTGFLQFPLILKRIYLLRFLGSSISFTFCKIFNSLAREGYWISFLSPHRKTYWNTIFMEINPIWPRHLHFRCAKVRRSPENPFAVIQLMPQSKNYYKTSLLCNKTMFNRMLYGRRESLISLRNLAVSFQCPELLFLACGTRTADTE